MDNEELVINEGVFHMLANEFNERFRKTGEEPSMGLAHIYLMEIMNENPVIEKELRRNVDIMINHILKEDE